jgi:hypothetical protein
MFCVRANGQNGVAFRDVSSYDAFISIPVQLFAELNVIPSISNRFFCFVRLSKSLELPLLNRC